MVQKVDADSHFYDHVTKTQMINELALYKSHPISMAGDPNNSYNTVMQEIKKVHVDRLKKYQLLIKQELGSKVHKQNLSNVGMSIYSNEKNVFVGLVSFDYRLCKDYKKYFYQTVTADEAINVEVVNESAMLETKQIGIFENKMDKSDNFFGNDNQGEIKDDKQSNEIVENKINSENKKSQENEVLPQESDKKPINQPEVEENQVEENQVKEPQDENKISGIQRPKADDAPPDEVSDF